MKKVQYSQDLNIEELHTNKFFFLVTLTLQHYNFSERHMHVYVQTYMLMIIFL
jgi:hypothetical protein